MKRFTFIDGLSGLYLPHHGPSTSRSEAHNTLRSADLASIQSQMLQALRTLKASTGGRKVILVIDQVDLLHATSCDEVSAVAIINMLLELRQVSACILVLRDRAKSLRLRTRPFSHLQRTAPSCHHKSHHWNRVCLGCCSQSRIRRIKSLVSDSLTQGQQEMYPESAG